MAARIGFLMAARRWKAQRNLEAVIDQPLEGRKRTDLLTT